MRDITEILVHWQAGRPLKEIVRSLGVSRNTARKHIKLATSVGYEQGGRKLSGREWSAILRKQAPSLVDFCSRSRVFAEIARYHEPSRLG